MAKDKKSLDDDLLTGGASISSEANDKDAKKEAKSAAKNKAKAEKTAKAKEKLQKELAEVKEAAANETDEAKKAKLDEKAKALSAKIASVGKKGNGLSKKAVKTIKSVVAIVIVVALLAAYVSTGLVRKGFISYLGWPAQTVTGMTVSDDKGHKANIKVSTYNFYFAQTYNSLQQTQSQYEQYGMDLATYNMDVDFDQSLSKQMTKDSDGNEITWLEYIQNQVYDTIETNYTYYLEAVAANDGKEPEITEEQKADIDTTLDSYRDSAHKYGFTLSAYLVKAMGKGVTEKTFRREATVQDIANNYKDELSKKASSTDYSDEKYNEYKKEHNSELKSVDIRYFECDSEDDAKSFARALTSNASNFTSLASKYAADDFHKEYYKDANASTGIGYTRSTLTNLGLAIGTADEKKTDSYPGLDWLFNSKRQAGDVKQYSTTVVYVIKPATLDETAKTVNVRHILISPITEADSETQPVDATTEQWKTAYETAKSILKQFNDGKKTADEFGKLATKNSTDTGSASKGGLYENVVPGQMVPTFGNWCYDSSRKPGDTAIIQSEYGYHIMYFVGKSDMPIWKYTAQQAYASEDNTSNTDAIDKAYTIDVKWFGSRYFEKDTDIDN